MIPDELKTLARAARDFAELKTVYKNANELCADIQKALDHIANQYETIDRLERRINEIRNARDGLLGELQDVVRRLYSAMRRV